MIDFFYTVLYQPLFNVLLFLYTAFGDLGVSIIILTLVIKFALYPLSKKATKSQKELQELQPEIKKIQDKYKEDKETQAKKIMEFYKEKKINPFSGILPLLIQLPLLIVLLQIFIRGFESEQMKHLYSFIPDPGSVNYIFLGFIDLSSPSIFLAILAAGGQFLQMKYFVPQKTKGEGMMGNIQTQMLYILPGVTFFILLSLPAAVGVYWVVTVVFTIFQQYLIKKDDK